MFKYLLLFVFKLQLYKKIDFLQNLFCVKIPFFCHSFVIFPGIFENYYKLPVFDLFNVPKIFNLQLETTPEVLNWYINLTNCGVHSYKKKKHTYIVVELIHLSPVQNLKKILSNTRIENNLFLEYYNIIKTI